MRRDRRGLEVTAASDAAAAALDAALDDFLAFGREAGQLLKEAFEADRDMPLAQALRGYFFLLMGVGALVPRAAASAESALGLPATARERAHGEALRHWAAGDTRAAVARLEDILLDHPRDILALRLAHYLHFYHGALAQHRDSVARVLPAWDETVPGYGYVLGMRAFGLEEVGDYARAEEFGRRAVAIDPSDAWSVHAVAHVMEMQGRAEEGIAWIRENEPHWEHRIHNFAGHLWWHQALFHLALDDEDAALALYDGRFRADTGSDDVLDIANAASMLLRLHFRGVDAGGRWRELADHSAGRLADGVFPFFDAHYMTALAMAGEGERVEAHLAALAGRAGGATADRVYDEVGRPLCEAIAAFGAGRPERCFALLEPVRYELYRLGGSHAQRDVFHQLLIAAARDAGRTRELQALLAERQALKPGPLPAWMRKGAPPGSER